MSESYAWTDLGTRGVDQKSQTPTLQRKPVQNTKKSTKDIVSDIIGMLEVTLDQSRDQVFYSEDDTVNPLSKQNTTVTVMASVSPHQSNTNPNARIINYFSRIDGILDHLARTQKPMSPKQREIYRSAVMKILEIPDDSTYTTIRGLIQLNLIFLDRLNLSLITIIASGIDSRQQAMDSIQNRWKTIDKAFFKPNITTLPEYSALIRAYYFQKYGKPLW